MPAAAIVGAAVVGGIMSSQAQKSSASKAARASQYATDAQTETTTRMFNQQRRDLAPFVNAGYAAQSWLSPEIEMVQIPGHGWVDRNAVLASPEQYMPQNALAIQKPEVVTVEPFIRDGSKMPHDRSTRENTALMPRYTRKTVTPGVSAPSAEQWMATLPKKTVRNNYSPILDVVNYAQRIEKLEFKFDENDPVYKWRQAENERMVNQFMASRGKYDSRAAANMLLNSGMNLQAQEVDRQYNQRYLNKYNKLMDLAGLAGNRYNMLTGIADRGLQAAGATTNAGATASNQLVQSSQINSTNQQNAILQQGAATANMWNNIGQAPMNYMLMSKLMK